MLYYIIVYYSMLYLFLCSLFLPIPYPGRWCRS